MDAYNESFRQLIEKQKLDGSWHTQDKGDIIADAVTQAAKQHLTRVPTTQKKDYLSDRTWQLILQKEKEIEDGNLNLLPQLNKDIKRFARQDKESAAVRQLEEADAQGYKWEGLKAARKTFQPRRTKFKNKHGQIIKESDFADEAATYLETVQWASPADDDLNLSYENQFIFSGDSLITDENFTEAELDHVLKAQKHGKTPGPDKCPAEFFQWLNHQNRHILLECFNDILDRDIYPESFKLANIVSIYKKGDATQMKNYRPIALLQTLYKILAGLIKNRLIQTYDAWIQKSQFGFRPKKSTAQAIFIARRLMDISERTGANLSLVLLDWKMAFDKVNQTKLLQALRRLKVPPRMLKTIGHIYSTPKFRVATGGHSSTFRTQHSGIRQGCPLSPYLFVILMSTLFHDIKQRLTTPKQKEPLSGIEYTEILFADDTLIFGNYTHHINLLLKEIQLESKYYNMELNLDKCVNLTLNQKQSSVKYLDGTPVPRKKSAFYLGTLLTDTVDNHREIMNRIADCTRTCNQLKLFWNKAKTSIKWKVQVFHSILRSKLLYGLETIQLNLTDQKRIDSFQLKGYRRILHLPPTYIDRTITNDFVKSQIRNHMNTELKMFSSIWQKRKLSLLGHIIRSAPSDPMRQVLFEKGTLVPRLEFRKRPGKPRQQWLITTYDDAYQTLNQPQPFDMDNPAHRQLVNDLACQRIGVFS